MHNTNTLANLTTPTRREAIKLGAAVFTALGASGLGLSTAAAAAESASEVIFSNPGTYTAEAPGRNGAVSVTLTASENAIESIEVDSVETTNIGGQGTDILIDQILTNQSTNVDIVSGATFSTSAFIRALNDCIEQAGGNTEALSNPIEQEAIEYETTADVVIVGAGGAGVVAALAAAESGASVILLEKSNLIGGNSNAAWSGILTAESRVQLEQADHATIEDFRQTQLNNNLARPELVDVYVENSHTVIDWIEDLGVNFTVSDRNNLEISSQTDVSHTGCTIIAAVYDAIQQNDDIKVYKQVSASKLVTDTEGRVSGVLATLPDGSETTFEGKAVILTTGGFGKNHDLLVRYRPDFVNGTTDEIAPTTGDGLRMAVELGATPVDMDEINYFSRCAGSYSMITNPVRIDGAQGTVGIYVDKTAQRVAAEDNEHFTMELQLSLPDGMTYHIFPAEYSNDMINNVVATGFGYREDSVEALAEDLGLDPDTLRETVDKWNEDVDAGVDTLFGREDDARVRLDGELIGYGFQFAAHYFMGGVLIDPECHIVDIDGEPIPGLYGAGEVTGGMQGSNRIDGSGIGDSVVFGWLAAKAAAAEVLA